MGVCLGSIHLNTFDIGGDLSILLIIDVSTHFKTSHNISILINYEYFHPTIFQIEVTYAHFFHQEWIMVQWVCWGTWTMRCLLFYDEMNHHWSSSNTHHLASPSSPRPASSSSRAHGAANLALVGDGNETRPKPRRDSFRLEAKRLISTHFLLLATMGTGRSNLHVCEDEPWRNSFLLIKMTHHPQFY